MTMQLMVGADPELFVKKGGKFVTGHGLIPGDKVSPHKVEGGAVQVDGMALEFNINPAADADGFCRNIRTVMAQLAAMVPEHELVADPVAKFGKRYLKTMPEEALELGCDPDFNAYRDGAANPRPDGDVDFRTGGGHVHVGWTQDMDIEDPGHREAAMMLTRELDFYLGLPSLWWDEDNKRRAMYGKAGAYRVKSYGMEYRSLSNAWVRDDNLIKLVFENVQHAFNNLLNGTCLYEAYGQHIEKAVNNSDKDLARAVLAAANGRFGVGPAMPEEFNHV